MKKLFIILGATVLLAGCSKKSSDVDGPNDPGGITARIKTTTTDAGTETYTYDAQGRCALIQGSTGKKTVYKYETGKTTVTYYKANGDIFYSEYFELNEFGRAKRVTRNPEYDVDFEETRVYNADQTTKQITTKDDGNIFVDDFFYTNGSRDSIRNNNNGHWGNTMKFQYLDKVNNLSNVEFGRDFSGKENTKLIKSVTYCGSLGTCGEPIVSAYEFDAKGRVIKLVETQVGSSNGDEITYTYY